MDTLIRLGIHTLIKYTPSLCLEAEPHEGYGKADCVCVCVCVCVCIPAVTAQRLQCDES